jgi:hypothetical protein
LRIKLQTVGNRDIVKFVVGIIGIGLINRPKRKTLLPYRSIPHTFPDDYDDDFDDIPIPTVWGLILKVLLMSTRWTFPYCPLNFRNAKWFAIYLLLLL